MPHTHDSTSSTWSQTHPARRIRHWTGGVEGNARLTALTGLLLLVLLFVEGITLLRLRAPFPVHVFIGLLLVPPILLKLASTGYCFVRYYIRCCRYAFGRLVDSLAHRSRSSPVIGCWISIMP